MNVIGKIADFKYRLIGGNLRHQPLKAHKFGFVFLPNPCHPDYQDLALCEVTPTRIRVIKSDSREYRAAYIKIEKDLYTRAIAKFYRELYYSKSWYFENITLYQVEYHLYLRAEPGSFLIAAKANPGVSEIFLHYLDDNKRMLNLQIMYKFEAKRNCRVYKIFKSKGWHESLIDLIEYAQCHKMRSLGLKLTNGVRPFGTTA
ncbi:hypothetical protein CAEBREN_23578 [Caenorhabditis brenneri]|uniref:SH2 domain-containing protein n=1 Tax=Caenorhabditis brenneri TaxID=135651 RepID=G0MW85_CAEBE|nr:hypothetical protein CAEBREN_23578 [Caenorhabditis brenneri]